MPSVKSIWFSAFRKRYERRALKDFIKASGQQIIFPFYHTVSNDDLPHIKHLYRWRNVQEFESDMDFLLRNFTPLHYDDLINKRYQENTPYFHLSFDDGLSELYHIIRPILIEKGIPATLFINDAFVDNHDLMYRYKVSLLIEHFTKQSLLKCLNVLGKNKLNSANDPVQFLKQINYSEIPLVNSIAEHLGFDFSDYLRLHKPYLELSQLETMASEGFTIGAHSVDHPNFSDIDAASQHDQVKLSVDYVRNTFNISNPAFAFPFSADGADAALLQNMQSAYKISRSFGTAGLKRNTVENHIDRIPAEYLNWPLESIVKAEYHYYLAKKMIGK